METQKAPIDDYSASIQNSLFESVKSLKNKLKKPKYIREYFPEILGKAFFLSLISYKRKSIEGSYDRYTPESRVSKINEIITISSTIREVSNWLNSGMKIPRARDRLEERINEEIKYMGVEKLCDLNSDKTQRIYFLLLDKLKPHCNNGTLSNIYKEIGGALENMLSFNSTFIEKYQEFKTKYENTKDKIEKINLCGTQLEKEEEEIAKLFGRKEDWIILFNSK